MKKMIFLMFSTILAVFFLGELFTNVTAISQSNNVQSVKKYSLVYWEDEPEFNSYHDKKIPKKKLDQKDEKEKVDSPDEKEVVKKVTKDYENKKKRKENHDVKIENKLGSYMSSVELNIRSGYGLEHSSVGVLMPNQKAEVSAEVISGGITWYKLKAGDIEGWASAKYLVPYKKVSTSKEVGERQSSKEKSVKKSKSANVGKKNSNGESKKYSPNHIYYGGRSIPYKNGGQANGQSIIDNSNYASTWGGASNFSGVDNLNTHFIGHNGGRNQFGDMHNYSTFIVTDSSGRAFKYVRTARYKVDERGVDTNTGADKWNRIVGSGGGERITLQSTYSHPIKWIVEAKLEREL